MPRISGCTCDTFERALRGAARHFRSNLTSPRCYRCAASQLFPNSFTYHRGMLASEHARSQTDPMCRWAWGTTHGKGRDFAWWLSIALCAINLRDRNSSGKDTPPGNNSRIPLHRGRSFYSCTLTYFSSWNALKIGSATRPVYGSYYGVRIILLLRPVF